MTRKPRLTVALTIAGSDSAGLAGIQADLKTFAALGVHGLTAVTAVTAQNSRAVVATHTVAPALLQAQLEALQADFRIGAIKIGMLASAAIARVVADWLERVDARNVVLDPVLVSSSGRPLLSAAGVRVLRERLLPLATIVTPNLPEAAALLGRPLTAVDDFREAAIALRGLGARAVLIKGGHARGRAEVIRDFYADARGERGFVHARLPYAARGTGCTLSSAIAAGLARGKSLRTALDEAEAYLQRCYRRARPIGRGAARALGHADD